MPLRNLNCVLEAKIASDTQGWSGHGFNRRGRPKLASKRPHCTSLSPSPNIEGGGGTAPSGVRGDNYPGRLTTTILAG